jgi:two-component system, OmpR family, sensor histidine kinase MprB
MSLQRRIAAAAAFGVAAVCLIIAPVGYLSTRAKLYQQVRLELQQLAPAQQPRTGLPPGAGNNPAANDHDADNAGANNQASCTSWPQTGGGGAGGPTGLGGVAGYFQSVCPNGKVVARNGGTPKLPVTAQVRAVARTLSGAFYFSAEVAKEHLEIYVVPDRQDKKAVEVAVPLTLTDNALRGLLLTYGLLLGVGIVLAAWIGALVARSALAPIRRFTSQTEQITSALDSPRRIEEVGAIEIRRMAASFNHSNARSRRSVT